MDDPVFAFLYKAWVGYAGLMYVALPTVAMVGTLAMYILRRGRS